MNLNSDLRDILSALNAADVRYLIVGGYAVGFYAEPRFTKDLDIWVDIDAENPEKVLEALKAFGAPLLDLSADDLATPGTVFQVGLPPNRIDILNELSGGVEFAQAWDNRTTIQLGDTSAPLIGIDDLISNKKAAARPQDLRDVRLLERAKKKLALKNDLQNP